MLSLRWTTLKETTFDFYILLIKRHEIIWLIRSIFICGFNKEMHTNISHQAVKVELMSCKRIAFRNALFNIKLHYKISSEKSKWRKTTKNCFVCNQIYVFFLKLKMKKKKKVKQLLDFLIKLKKKSNPFKKEKLWIFYSIKTTK